MEVGVAASRLDFVLRVQVYLWQHDAPCRVSKSQHIESWKVEAKYCRTRRSYLQNRMRDRQMKHPLSLPYQCLASASASMRCVYLYFSAVLLFFLIFFCGQRFAAHWPTCVSNTVRLSRAGLSSLDRMDTDCRLQRSVPWMDRSKSTVIGCCRVPCGTPSLVVVMYCHLRSRLSTIVLSV